MTNANVGLIGLAVMGQNLVLNMERNGYTVAVYNRTTATMQEFIDANPQGIKNSQLAHYLDLHSDNNGNQKDYLTYSILGLPMKEG